MLKEENEGNKEEEGAGRKEEQGLVENVQDVGENPVAVNATALIEVAAFDVQPWIFSFGVRKQILLIFRDAVI